MVDYDNGKNQQSTNINVGYNKPLIPIKTIFQVWQATNFNLILSKSTLKTILFLWLRNKELTKNSYLQIFQKDQLKDCFQILARHVLHEINLLVFATQDTLILDQKNAKPSSSHSCEALNKHKRSRFGVRTFNGTYYIVKTSAIQPKGQYYLAVCSTGIMTKRTISKLRHSLSISFGRLKLVGTL